MCQEWQVGSQKDQSIGPVKGPKRGPGKGTSQGARSSTDLVGRAPGSLVGCEGGVGSAARAGLICRSSCNCQIGPALWGCRASCSQVTLRMRTNSSRRELGCLGWKMGYLSWLVGAASACVAVPRVSPGTGTGVTASSMFKTPAWSSVRFTTCGGLYSQRCRAAGVVRWPSDSGWRWTSSDVLKKCVHIDWMWAPPVTRWMACNFAGKTVCDVQRL